MESEKSEFNVAVSYLQTINVLQALAAEAAMDIDFKRWRHTLAAMFRRVAPYLIDKDYNNLKNQLVNLTNIINKGNKQRFGKPVIQPQIISGLEDFEVDVLRLAKKHGLISKMEEDAGAALR